MSQVAAVANDITVTDSAAKKVYDLILEDGNPDLKLRVYITGGGCSGFQYGFSFEQVANEDDTVIKKSVAKESDHQHQVEFLVDPMSFQYLVGAEIDYVEDIEGERFIIRNPNAETTCGCGSSFAV